jgi:glycoside hydrolase-like protein
MVSQMTAAPIPTAARLADTDTVLTAGTAAAFRTVFDGVFRYVSRGAERPGDLSAGEAQIILGAGLGLVPVQHVAQWGWLPTADLGTAQGVSAATDAQAIGVPPGVCVALDLEGIGGATDENVTAFCNAWYDQVVAAGYVPLLYVGADDVLDAEELYYDLKFSLYWHGGSRVAPVPVRRGVCITQTIDPAFVLDGVSYDSNIAAPDALGGTATWWVGDAGAGT